VTNEVASPTTVGIGTNNASGTGYNGSFAITTVDATHFTYTATATGLAEVTNAGVATSTDGGLRALVADFSGANPVLYATTTGSTSNRLVKLADSGDLSGNGGTFTPTTLATAPTNEAFRGVAFAPVAPGVAPSSTSLNVTGSPGTYGGGVTLTATVTSGATGWVSFQQNGVEIGAAPLVGNTATLVTAGNLGAGSYNVVATYTGNTVFAASPSSAQAVTINKATPTVALGVAASPVGTGVADTLTATVTVPAGTAPTGTVTFFDGGTQISGTGNLATVSQVIVNQQGNPVIQFVATFSPSFATAGTHNLSATYNGDANFATNSGTASLLVVNSTTTAVGTSSANPTASPSTAVTYTATVTSAGGTPTGSVQFYDDLLPIGTPVTLNGSGMATATINTALVQAASGQPDVLTPGLHSISAVYTPDTAAQNTFFTSTGVYEQAVQAKAFAPADEFVERVGDGTTPIIAQTGPNAGAASVGNTIFIDEYTPAGALAQSLILPSADGTGSQNTIHAVVADGQQSPTGQLALSGDGQYLFLTGYDSNPLNPATAPLLHTASTTSRAVARIKYDGTIQTIGFVAGTSGVQTGGNINGVYSPDGNRFYVSGFNGVSYFSSFTPSAALQNATATITTTSVTVDGLENAGGNLALVNSAATNPNPVQQYTGFPSAAATPASLPGVTGAADTAGGQASSFTVDAFFTHLNGTGAPAGINTMYLSDDGPSFANGAITKWALVSGTWQVVDHVTAGSGNSAVSFYWLDGKTDGSGNVTLYVTYGQGGVNAPMGALYAIADSNGYNAPIGTGGTHSDAVSTVSSVSNTSNEDFRGVAFAPLVLPAVATAVVNGNNAALAGPQRSMVNSLVYTFNTPVTLGAGAFTIALHPNVTVNGSTGQTVGTLPTVAWSSPDGGTTWVVTFGGDSVVGGSIADGVYDITLHAAAVASNLNGQALAADRVDTFYRLYGDTSGHGTVNNADTFQLRSTFLKNTGDAGYLAYLDYDGNGTVNNADVFQFRKRFGTTFSGFNATI
jgi:hypothetical protein